METAELFLDLERDLTERFGELISGLFTVVLTLGKKAALACREAGLPEAVLESIEAAREYAEGRSIRLDVRTSGDVRLVTRLAEIKMSN